MFVEEFKKWNLDVTSARILVHRSHSSRIPPKAGRKHSEIGSSTVSGKQDAVNSSPVYGSVWLSLLQITG